MLKAKTMAYDGKGNAVAKSHNDVKDAYTTLGTSRGYTGREDWIGSRDTWM
jgi:phosphoribosylaminoimidazole carboxylase (NCAIR synthetase)